MAKRTAKNPKQRTLTLAAQKDYVRAYAEIGKPRLAHRAFARVDKSRAFDMLETLSDIYLENGKSEKAIFTLRSMITKKPQHIRVCSWQRSIAETMLSAGKNNGQKAAEIEKLVELYKHLGKKSPKQMTAEKRTALTECGEAASDMAGYMARVWHDDGYKTKNPEIMADAAKLYRLYLAEFPATADYGETEYFYAELLWRLAEEEKDDPRRAAKLWEKTATAFASVVNRKLVKGKQRKESAYAAVLAWQKAVNLEAHPRDAAADRSRDGAQKSATGKNRKNARPKPQSIPAKEKKMLAAFDFYIDNVGDQKDEELVGIKFLKAVTYARHHHHDRAIPIFADIVDNHPDHETAGWSAIRLLDGLILSQRDEQLIAWVRKLEKRRSFLEDQPELEKQLVTLGHTFLRKEAEKLEKRAEKTGDYRLYVACGKAYIDIYNRNTDAEDGDAVLYNAGVCFEEGKSLGVAFEVYGLLAERYPRSPQSHRGMARLGAAYARAGYYENSANTLLAYAKKFGGEENAAAALSNAVFFYKGAGLDDDAIKATELFVKRYGKKDPASAADAMYSMTAIYEKLNDPDKVVRHLRRYLRLYGKRGGLDRRGRRPRPNRTDSVATVVPGKGSGRRLHHHEALAQPGHPRSQQQAPQAQALRRRQPNQIVSDRARSPAGKGRAARAPRRPEALPRSRQGQDSGQQRRADRAPGPPCAGTRPRRASTWPKNNTRSTWPCTCPKNSISIRPSPKFWPSPRKNSSIGSRPSWLRPRRLKKRSTRR